MANDARRDAEPVFKAENEVDLLLGGANPNPTREGCPPREALIALARRQVPVGDLVGEHVSKCSPCYRDMRAIQQAEGIRPADERRAGRSWWPAAAAAVLVVTAGLMAWLAYGIRQPSATPGPEQVVADAEPVAVELDLRKHGVTRSDATADELRPLVLPRAKVRLTLLLPVGSEPGTYEVRFVAKDTTTVSGGGTAEVHQFVATMSLGLDLSKAVLGPGLLIVRHEADGEQIFSATVQ